MRKFSLALISRAGVALLAPLTAMAAPPQRLEVVYEVSRSGFVIAEIVERLEHGDGKYELSETMRGRGLLALRGSIKRSSREGPEVQPLPPNAQDRLSFLLAFAFAPPGAQPVKMSVADGGSVSRYVFAVVGRERLKIPAGEFDAVKVARLKDGPEDRRSTEIWLAPSQGYIPIRMLVTDKDGTQLDQVATKISGQ